MAGRGPRSWCPGASSPREPGQMAVTLGLAGVGVGGCQRGTGPGSLGAHLGMFQQLRKAGLEVPGTRWGPGGEHRAGAREAGRPGRRLEVTRDLQDPATQELAAQDAGHWGSF